MSNYPNGQASESLNGIWISGDFTPADVCTQIIDNVSPVNKNTMINSVGKEISSIQNFVNKDYLGRYSAPVNSGFIKKFLMPDTSQEYPGPVTVNITGLMVSGDGYGNVDFNSYRGMTFYTNYGRGEEANKILQLDSGGDVTFLKDVYVSGLIVEGTNQALNYRLNISGDGDDIFISSDTGNVNLISSWGGNTVHAKLNASSNRLEVDNLLKVTQTEEDYIANFIGNSGSVDIFYDGGVIVNSNRDSGSTIQVTQSANSPIATFTGNDGLAIIDSSGNLTLGQNTQYVPTRLINGVSSNTFAGGNLIYLQNDAIVTGGGNPYFKVNNDGRLTTNASGQDDPALKITQIADNYIAEFVGNNGSVIINSSGALTLGEATYDSERLINGFVNTANSNYEMLYLKNTYNNGTFQVDELGGLGISTSGGTAVSVAQLDNSAYSASFYTPDGFVLIDGQGNLGLNTYTPSADLHIVGTTKLDGPTSFNGATPTGIAAAIPAPYNLNQLLTWASGISNILKNYGMFSGLV
jgi:hypothetical protein